MALGAHRPPSLGLSRVLAVSPLLDPARSTAAIDSRPLIKKYFLNKWRRSLIRKQELYPQLYKFGDLLGLDSVLEITAALVRRYSDYDGVSDYFQKYTLTGKALSGLETPALMVTARDDPVIPVRDFEGLELPAHSTVNLQQWGGHNAFLQDLAGRRWYEPLMLELFKD